MIFFGAKYMKRNNVEPTPGEGGGGGLTRHMTGYASVSKKSVETVYFSGIRRRRGFL